MGLTRCNAQGKDEVFLCTLSNFDVFEVPPSANHMVRPPRQCAFGIKSLDKLSFFETKTDFVHYFCTKDTAVATDWMRRIYDARVRRILPRLDQFWVADSVGILRRHSSL